MAAHVAWLDLFCCFTGSLSSIDEGTYALPGAASFIGALCRLSCKPSVYHE
jgi:hypothetical protein